MCLLYTNSTLFSVDSCSIVMCFEAKNHGASVFVLPSQDAFGYWVLCGSISVL